MESRVGALDRLRVCVGRSAGSCWRVQALTVAGSRADVEATTAGLATSAGTLLNDIRCSTEWVDSVAPGDLTA